MDNQFQKKYQCFMSMNCDCLIGQLLSLPDYKRFVIGTRRKEGNVRIYVPLDLNKSAILKRLNSLITHYDEANEENEMNFSQDVSVLISQIGSYDQIGIVRHMPQSGKHSVKTYGLVKEFTEKWGAILNRYEDVFI